MRRDQIMREISTRAWSKWLPPEEHRYAGQLKHILEEWHQNFDNYQNALHLVGFTTSSYATSLNDKQVAVDFDPDLEELPLAKWRELALRDAAQTVDRLERSLSSFSELVRAAPTIFSYVDIEKLDRARILFAQNFMPSMHGTSSIPDGFEMQAQLSGQQTTDARRDELTRLSAVYVLVLEALGPFVKAMAVARHAQSPLAPRPSSLPDNMREPSP